jgi:lambda repressor-like predicted transcriptional regulator
MDIHLSKKFLLAVKQNGWELHFSPPEFRDREVVLAAVKQNGWALEYRDFRGDREIILAAVKQNGWELQAATPELRGDREIVLVAVKQYGSVLQYANNELRGDREVVLAAVKQNGWALQYTIPDFRGDREIVLAAVKQNGRVLEYTYLRGDREIVLAAIRQDDDVLQFATQELRSDPWLNRKPLENFKILVKMALKFERQDNEYKKWLHPEHILMKGYLENYLCEDADKYIPNPLSGLLRIYKKRKICTISCVAGNLLK